MRIGNHPSKVAAESLSSADPAQKTGRVKNFLIKGTRKAQAMFTGRKVAQNPVPQKHNPKPSNVQSSPNMAMQNNMSSQMRNIVRNMHRVSNEARQETLNKLSNLNPAQKTELGKQAGIVKEEGMAAIKHSLQGIIKRQITVDGDAKSIRQLGAALQKILNNDGLTSDDKITLTKHIAATLNSAGASKAVKQEIQGQLMPILQKSVASEKQSNIAKLVDAQIKSGLGSTESGSTLQMMKNLKEIILNPSISAGDTRAALNQISKSMDSIGKAGDENFVLEKLKPLADFHLALKQTSGFPPSKLPNLISSLLNGENRNIQNTGLSDENKTQALSNFAEDLVSIVRNSDMPSAHKMALIETISHEKNERLVNNRNDDDAPILSNETGKQASSSYAGSVDLGSSISISDVTMEEPDTEEADELINMMNDSISQKEKRVFQEARRQQENLDKAHDLFTNRV